MSTKSIDELLEMAEKFARDVPQHEETVTPTVNLSPEEIRKRFDEYGNPREGYDTDGNPLPSNRTDRRRTRWA